MFGDRKLRNYQSIKPMKPNNQIGAASYILAAKPQSDLEISHSISQFTHLYYAVKEVR